MYKDASNRPDFPVLLYVCLCKIPLLVYPDYFVEASDYSVRRAPYRLC